VSLTPVVHQEPDSFQSAGAVGDHSGWVRQRGEQLADDSDARARYVCQLWAVARRPWRCRTAVWCRASLAGQLVARHRVGAREHGFMSDCAIGDIQPEYECRSPRACAQSPSGRSAARSRPRGPPGLQRGLGVGRPEPAGAAADEPRSGRPRSGRHGSITKRVMSASASVNRKCRSTTTPGKSPSRWWTTS
jgi:hypothetical protein